MVSPAGRHSDKNGHVPDGSEPQTVRNSPQAENGRVVDGSAAENVQNSPHVGPGRSRAARLVLFALVATAVVALDQLSKVAARAALTPGDPVTLIPGVMDLSLTYNTGAAFSMGEGAGPFFVLIALVMCAAGVYVAWRRTDVPLSLLLVGAGVVGGGIGNAIDRVAFGAVTDFFKTTFMDFAIFNVADIFVTCGVFVALVLWWCWDARQEREHKETAA